MDGNNNIRHFGKFGLIAVIVLVLANLSCNKLKAPDSGHKLIKRETATTPVRVGNRLNDSIVAFGMTFLGTPYKAGGCGEDGFDCSGFVYFVFRHYKIDVPRSSAGFEHFGKEIPIEDVEKGDLLLFLSPTRNVIGHIGIVSTADGAASSFVHASSGSEMKVIISSLAAEGYKRRFVKAVRVL